LAIVDPNGGHLLVAMSALDYGKLEPLTVADPFVYLKQLNLLLIRMLLT